MLICVRVPLILRVGARACVYALADIPKSHEYTFSCECNSCCGRAYVECPFHVYESSLDCVYSGVRKRAVDNSVYFLPYKSRTSHEEESFSPASWPNLVFSRLTMRAAADGSHIRAPGKGLMGYVTRSTRRLQGTGMTFAGHWNSALAL